jgi:Tfp pilus assembly PilM family ATPase
VVEVREASLGFAQFRRERGSLTLSSAAALALPEGALRLSLSEPNVVDREAVDRTLTALLDRSPVPRGGRIALVLPDSVARVRTFAAEEVRGRRPKETEELVRFRLRRSVPFDVRDARVAFAPTGSAKDAPLLVAAMSRRVLGDYEALFESHRLQPGVVDLAGLALLSALSRGDESDWLLVNWEDSYVSFLLVQHGRLALVRTLSGSGASSPHRVSQEAASTVLYYRNRLGGTGLTRAVVRCAGDLHAAIAILEEPLGVRPEEPSAWGAVPDLAARAQLPQTLAGGLSCVVARAA